MRLREKLTPEFRRGFRNGVIAAAVFVLIAGAIQLAVERWWWS